MNLPAAPGAADPNDEAAVTALIAHPRFPEAFRLLTGRFLALHQGKLIPKLMANEPRYIIAHFAMTLHGEYRADDPTTGLIPTRLIERCLAMKIMSRGRVEAMLATLRAAGWLIEAPPGEDRRIRRLEPGPPMVADFRARAAFHLEALDLIMPGRGYLELLASQPAFFWALEAERGKFVAAQPSLRLSLPPLAALAAREGAYAMMVALLGARDQGQAGLPEAGEVSLAKAGIAKRLALSRSQVGRVLEDLAAHRLITRPEEGGAILRVEKLAIQVMARWYAIRLLRFDRNGVRAAAAVAVAA